MTEETALRESPLAAEHEALGAKMVPFAGWRMPLRYQGVLDEHLAVRSAAGLFDVTHMGEFVVRGPGAEEFLQLATPNDVSKLRPGRAHYSALLTANGTYLDDLLIYRLEADVFLMVVNAVNVEQDLSALLELEPEGVELIDDTERYCLLALQGPKAAEVLEPLVDGSLGKLKYYRCRRAKVAGKEVVLARTGYTGEDGFEIFADAADAVDVWRSVMSAGEPHGLVPAGLGARDTLRTEAGMALYGHELDQETNPFEAGLGWTVKLGKGPFRGREALDRIKKEGPRRKLVGFEVTGRGIARRGHSVFAGGEEVGTVTSGTFSPTLDKAIGMAYLPVERAEVGDQIEIEVRGRRLAAVQVALPFYKRSD